MRIIDYAEAKEILDNDVTIIDTDHGTFKITGAQLKKYITNGLNEADAPSSDDTISDDDYVIVYDTNDIPKKKTA